MPYEETGKKAPRAHEVNLTGRARLTLTGVDDVSGFDDNAVVLTTSMGELTVRGSGLHIERIDLDAGQLELRGSVQELSYEEESSAPSLWSRLCGG